MLRSLVGSEMCIRDRYRGPEIATCFLHFFASPMQALMHSDKGFLSSVTCCQTRVFLVYFVSLSQRYDQIVATLSLVGLIVVSFHSITVLLEACWNYYCCSHSLPFPSHSHSSPIPHSHSNFPDISSHSLPFPFPSPAITIFRILERQQMYISVSYTHLTLPTKRIV